MATWSSLAVAEPWDLAADGYAGEADAIMAPFSRRAVELAKLDRRARVIDVACGPGTLSLAVAPQVASVTAVDFSSQMLARLREQARERGLDNLQAVEADGQALPLPDGAFDAGFSMFGWMFFPDRAKGLAELKRVLVPGASLVVSSWATAARSPLMAAMLGALRAADETFPEPVYNPDSLENPERISAELSAAGFSEVAVHECTLSAEFDGIDALWSRMTRASAPITNLRKRLGEALWIERSALSRAYLARELGDKPHSLSTTAWLGFGVRA